MRNDVRLKRLEVARTTIATLTAAERILTALNGALYPDNSSRRITGNSFPVF
jgi:hypothetical protein